MVQLRALVRAGEVLATEGDTLACHDAAGRVRWQVEVPELTEAALIGDLVWCAARHQTRVSRFDLGGAAAPARDRARTPRAGALAGLAARRLGGVVWRGRRGAAPRWHGRAARLRGRGAHLRGPVAPLESREAAVMLHSVGELWSTELDTPGSQLVAAATLADGRLLALAIWPRQSAGELRLVVLGSRAGDVMSRMRLASSRVLFAPRRAAAVVQVDRGLEIIDLRFGRSMRSLEIDPDLRELVVDETLEHVATLRDGGRIEIMTFAELERRHADREAARGGAGAGCGRGRGRGRGGWRPRGGPRAGGRGPARRGRARRGRRAPGRRPRACAARVPRPRPHRPPARGATSSWRSRSPGCTRCASGRARGPWRRRLPSRLGSSSSARGSSS